MYYLKKLASLLITIFIISLLTFFLLQVIPGDAALVALGTDATDEAVEELRESWGLNDPLIVQYGRWAGDALRGNFGESAYYKTPVSELISERIVVSLILGLMAILFIVIIAYPIGILSARYEDKFIDKFLNATGQVFMAIPPFFLGMLLIIFFGLVLSVFNIGGYVSYKKDFAGFISYLILPAIAIALPKSAMLARFFRTNLVKEKRKAYVKTARAFGVGEGRIIVSHVQKNAMIPTITFFGVLAAEVLAGSVIIEQVFSIQGIGKLLIFAVSVRDYKVIQALMLYIGSIVVSINCIVDLLYYRLDPTVKKEGEN